MTSLTRERDREVIEQMLDFNHIGPPRSAAGLYGAMNSDWDVRTARHIQAGLVDRGSHLGFSDVDELVVESAAMNRSGG